MLKSNIDVFFVTSFLCSLKFLLWGGGEGGGGTLNIYWWGYASAHTKGVNQFLNGRVAGSITPYSAGDRHMLFLIFVCCFSIVHLLYIFI